MDPGSANSQNRPDLQLLLRRLGSLGCAALLALILPQFAGDPELRAVVPWFVALLYVQLAPVFWTVRPNLFTPVVYTGFMAATSTASTLAYFFKVGRIDINLVSGLAPDEVSSLAQTTLAALALGHLCYYAGYYHPSWGRACARLYPNVTTVAWDQTKLRFALAITAGLFVVSYAYFQVRLDVPLFDLSKLKAGKDVWRDDPTLSWMTRGVELGSIPVLFYLAFAARESWRRAVLWMGVLLCVGLLVLRVGQRGFLFNPLLCGVVIVHFLRKRISVLVFAAAMIVGMVASSVFLEWRTGYAAQEGSVELADVTERPTTILAVHEDDRRRFSALALLFHEFPEKREYLVGETWVGIGTLLIPRWVWPEKVEHNRWRDTKIVWNLTGAPLPTSYLGALYCNFSWIGIVLGMLLWGAVHRGLNEWRLRDEHSPGRILLYTMLLVFFGFTMIQLSATLQWAVPVYLIARYARQRTAGDPVRNTAR